MSECGGEEFHSFTVCSTKRFRDFWIFGFDLDFGISEFRSFGVLSFGVLEF